MLVGLVVLVDLTADALVAFGLDAVVLAVVFLAAVDEEPDKTAVRTFAEPSVGELVHCHLPSINAQASPSPASS